MVSSLLVRRVSSGPRYGPRRDSASADRVRNLYIWKTWPNLPTRAPRYRTGRPEGIRTSAATIAHSGASTASRTVEIKMSKPRRVASTGRGSYACAIRAYCSAIEPPAGGEVGGSTAPSVATRGRAIYDAQHTVDEQ